MKAITIVTAAVLGLAAAHAAQASEALASSGGCMGCHAVEKKVKGPAFKDVAAKYKGKPEAEAALLAKVGDPKKHPGTASADDRKAIVKWILAM